MIYLASPYWHDSEEIRRERVLRASLLTGLLLQTRIPAYSPLSHGAPIADRIEIEERLWIAHGLAMLSRCLAIVVYAQDPGWMVSKGIRAEMDRAGALRLPMYVTRKGASPRDAAEEIMRWTSCLDPAKIKIVS